MDDADRADELIEAQMADRLVAIHTQTLSFISGAPGECDLCGEWSGRLVSGACAPCRDRYHLE